MFASFETQLLVSPLSNSPRFSARILFLTKSSKFNTIPSFS